MSLQRGPITAGSGLFDRRSARARATGVLAVSLALVAGLAGCSPQQSSAGGAAGGASEGEVDAELVLLGNPGFAFEDFALDLEDLGYDVSDEAAVSSDTDLVLVVVNAQDGPMPQTREAVEALAGSTVPRVAIALVDVDKQTDAEIETLVVRETVELLARYGIAPVDSGNIVRSPGTDIASVLETHLRRAPRDYHPALPADPPPLVGPVMVDNFAGVPMSDALEILAAQGLVGEVLADPDFGVVSECDPLVMDQEPVSGTMLPLGGTVGLLVSAPDKVDPAMVGCLLPEMTRGQIDARRAELAAQPSG
ncbi:PASTA domain-containing protein [Microbacterium sp. SS28]|uniref:PASTA domain-containing protein n=1 Tax=Microbacterium sp. SS28 TaxID=2919948 RepID=UPI001FAA2118|nr:PASTA domain-containing protein [Microbacterium sp. SS28]